MKRTLAILLAAALLLGLLPACNQEGTSYPTHPADETEDIPTTLAPEETKAASGPTAQELVEAVCAAMDDVPEGLEALNAQEDGERLAVYVENAYGLAAGDWEDAAIIRATGVSAFELAVLKLEDEKAAVRTATALMSYIFARQGDFAGYAPAQADMVANGSLSQDGPYAALFICPDPDSADAAFEAALNGQPIPVPPPAEPEPEDSNEPDVSTPDEPETETEMTPVPVILETPSLEEPDEDWPDRIPYVDPGKEDMSLYDTSAIRAAWAAGDPSGLSDYDRAVYDAAEEVLGEILTTGMTDLEKETAIYYWIVNNVDYDWTHQDILAETPRESYEPYGGLVNRTAVCLGYATTFQLLMDLAGVECITVVGAAFYSTEEHAWNMVRLNGEWYCLDVTWDANYREQIGSDWPAEYWNHFNVTSDEMAEENHQWDYANTPEATAEDHGRG